MVYTTDDNNYGTAKLIVGTSGHANYLTIASALTAATSGDTIFILPGTYTENLTLVAGVNLTAFGCDASLNGTGHVIISGNCTFSGTGSVTISGIQLQTNSAAALTVSGSSASVVNLNNCYLNFTNATGISYSSSSSSSRININNCFGDLGTTGIAFHSMSSTGTLYYYFCQFFNTGASTTASSNSAGMARLERTVFHSPFSTSSTGVFFSKWSFIDTSTQNATCLSTVGTAISLSFYSGYYSGSASTINIDSGTSFWSSHDTVWSTHATTAITGTGGIQYQCLSFTGSCKTINTTTQGDSGTIQGSKNTAPSAGYLGEQIRANVTTPGNSINNATYTTITSIDLTPGVWDISAIIGFNQVTALTGTRIIGLISTTTNSAGASVEGDSQIQSPTIPNGNSNSDLSIPSFRVTPTTATTYYLVGYIAFSAGTAKAFGRISATRVG